MIDGPFKMVYDVGNWIFRFMYLHILWVIFTVVGLGVFGISPATSALFSVMHKWMSENPDAPIFKHFFETYKKEFVKANALGLVIVGIGAFFYVDFMISKHFIQSFFVHIILMFFILPWGLKGTCGNTVMMKK